jgi:hypothetical protein
MSSTNKTNTVAGIKNNAKSPNEIPSNKIVAPTINNKSTKSTEIKNNASSNAIPKPSTNNPSSNNNSDLFQTAKEEAGVYEVVSENYLLLLGISSAIIIMIIIFFFSESFRVNRTIAKMLVYQGFLEISSLDYAKLGKKRLGDFYIASAYNASHSGYQMYDYTSENIVLAILQSGARYLEFNIFNSEFGDKAFPVVSMGYKQGEWKMMVNDTPLETIFELIANNAFKISDGKEGVNNPDDPLFIGLNLNTNSNLSCLNLIAFLITKYFSNRLLDNAYSFQNNDAIADIPMIQLTGNNSSGGKIVFFASDGFQGSGLEEIINYSWDNIDNNPKHALQRLHYSTIIEPTFNSQSLIEYNRKGFTIIVPHVEGDFFNNNYNPIKAFELGCQFVAMEYQDIDSNMDIYITKFKKSSFVMKSADLQKGKTNLTKTSTTKPQTSSTTTTSTRPQVTRGGF